MTMTSSANGAPVLAPNLQAILEQDVPRFSAAEMQRRRRAIEQAMAAKGVDHLVVYGADRSGGGVQWLTGWPVTTEAAIVVTPSRRDAMYIHYFNHIPLARQLARDADVDWGGEGKAIEPAIAELKRRGARADRVGIIGPVGYAAHAALSAAFGAIADLNPNYIRMRMIKSEEELDWLRIGAHFSDLAVVALRSHAKPGVSEIELGDIVERSYMTLGGTNRIHYFGVTPMDNPDCCVPRQYPLTRKLRSGDILFAEISANFWDYSGQVLRSFTIDAEPTPLYRELYAVAEEAYAAVSAVLRPGATPQDVVAAASVIEKAGFTTCDDLVHGYGGGYLPPVLGSQSRPAGPLPAMTFEAGMTVVVQPNVITRDQRAGVQLGELMRITDAGAEPLHQVPREFYRL
jgi:Xaa-Pro aminopeptidase